MSINRKLKTETSEDTTSLSHVAADYTQPQASPT